jgi:HNH endonuclease
VWLPIQRNGNVSANRRRSNPRCCCHCDRRSVSRRTFCAVAMQQNAVSLGRLPRFTSRSSSVAVRCFYCLEDSSRSRSVPHVIPEALLKNSVVLPVGAVCDACNHYFGHELDATLVSHPVVSLVVQFLRLPGKRGNVRDRVGLVDSTIYQNTITIACGEPSLTTAEDGTEEATITPLIDPAFSFRRFRRALHHVGLNTLALKEGVEFVLDRKYDAVRRYIRSPQRTESWPFAQFIDLSVQLEPEVESAIYHDEVSDYQSLHVGNVAVFGVELRGTGSVSDLATANLPKGTIVIPPGFKPRPARASDKSRRYRLNIDLSG